MDVKHMVIRLIFLFVFPVMLSLSCLAQDKPKKPYELHEEAERAYNSGKYKEALALLDQCLKVNPGFMDAYALRGSVREQLQDNDGALTDYSIYLEKFPEHREVLINRAVLRYRIGFYDQAKEDFLKLLLLPSSGETNAIFYKQAMSVDDKNPMMTMTGQNNHASYILNYLGLTESKLKNFPQAKHYFDSAIRINATEPDYFVNRGLVKESLNDSTAINDYEQALKLNPRHTLANHNLKALRSKKEQTTSLEERLNQTIEADSTMLYPYLERAQQRYESKYYQGAIDDYSMALEIDPGNVEIWLGRGLAKEKIKDYKGAFSDYTKAIELKENFAKAWLNRGNVLVKLERYDDAIEDYNVALIYYADYPLAFYNRAMAHIKLKKNDLACADLKRAEELGMEVERKVKSKACE
ncbi:tetratricopeptide repeat protein [Fulvivirgaceae bacterium PWU4]|uniref:Tetratricopeptide repeat protein n=1 Tax=Chryseosolibacter histidini TaxID=2782349 RepID=A0AAP2GT83_9BACT|nr:tetratricopeptide repeat protein [Chryseosolibacter histidini]MBT1701392.1 tetratricopeptide repeat protein [Chryseosolibacter histidini]